MNKLKLGIIVGGGLGLLDGLSTFFAPEAVKMGVMPMIIVGSTVKGLVTGILAGWLANRYRSLPRAGRAQRRCHNRDQHGRTGYGHCLRR